MWKSARNKPDYFASLATHPENSFSGDRAAGLSNLQRFFSAIRPDSRKSRRMPAAKLRQATSALQGQPAVRHHLQQALLSQLIRSDLVPAITQSGIPLARGFWQELGNRLKHKLLPPLREEHDFLTVIHNVFYRKNDYKWVEAVPRQDWIDFFEAVRFSFSPVRSNLQNILLRALRVLSIQVAQLGYEKEILHFLPPGARDDRSPFNRQQEAALELEKTLGHPAVHAEGLASVANHLKKSIADCQEQVEQIRNGHVERGASLQQTYLLLILANRLERMQLLADVLDADNQFDTGRFVDIFRMLVRNENRKNSIREFLSQGMGYLAYQIAEHKGVKGHKYITESRGDFFRMIRSACWGGFIISFIVVFKNLIGRLSWAPVPMGFLYSVNYSAGFILIEETGSTLATKQPAFTASAVAASLDNRKSGGEPDLQSLAATVARVSRSQLASFFGNLVVVFPLSFLFATGWHLLFGEKLATPEQSLELLRGQHPFQSAAWLYACFTGFFLFLSGLIAGYWQNKIQYGRIRERLMLHPVLRVSLSPRRLERLAHYVEKHFGALVGSVALGFFLGFSGVVGKIFGVPFDIRHITIAAGNFGIGLNGMEWGAVPLSYILLVFAGVLGIGFFNFLISFSLAFMVAVKSRGIHLSEYPRLFGVLIRYFFRHPREFFLPPRRRARVEYKPLEGGEDTER